MEDIFGVQIFGVQCCTNANPLQSGLATFKSFLTCSHYPGTQSCCSRPEPRWPATGRRARRMCPSLSRGYCRGSPRPLRARRSLHRPLPKAAGSAKPVPPPPHPPLPQGRVVGESDSGGLGVGDCDGRVSFQEWCNGAPPRPGAGCESWAPRWGWGWSRGSRLSPGAHTGNLKEVTVRKQTLNLALRWLADFIQLARSGCAGIRGIKSLKEFYSRHVKARLFVN